MTEPTGTLALERLSFGFPGVPDLLREIDLAVAPGELTVLVGPNGAGKSTLLRLAAGLVEPQAGRVTIGGDDLAGLRPRERARRVAFVPQALARVPAVTVERFVASGRYAHRALFGGASAADRAALEDALAALDLGALRRRLLPELSGGQRQLALLARALCQDTPVVLVDEPTTGLDLPHQLDAFERIALLACGGRAVLAVSHELNLASQFAGRIALLHDGDLERVGPPAEVLTPAVLGPIYGPRLAFGALPNPGGAGECPTVIPWSAPRSDGL